MDFGHLTYVATHHEANPSDHCNWWNTILFTILKSEDIIAVAAAGAPGLTAYPADCPDPPLIVASSSDNHRLASFANKNDGYLYAPGSIPPAPESTPTSCPSQNIECEGTDVSAGQVSGLVAYFLSLSAGAGIAALPGYNNDQLQDAGERWFRMKLFLLDSSYYRLSPAAGGEPPAVPEIWNRIGRCSWVNARDDTGIECARPSSSTSTISTIPTHHALNNNGSSTLTTSSTLISSSGVLTTLRPFVSTCI